VKEKRYEIIEWCAGYNIADNKCLNLVVFSDTLTKEEADIELLKLESNNANSNTEILGYCCPICGYMQSELEMLFSKASYKDEDGNLIVYCPRCKQDRWAYNFIPKYMY